MKTACGVSTTERPSCFTKDPRRSQTVHEFPQFNKCLTFSLPCRSFVLQSVSHLRASSASLLEGFTLASLKQSKVGKHAATTRSKNTTERKQPNDSKNGRMFAQWSLCIDCSCCRIFAAFLRENDRTLRRGYIAKIGTGKRMNGEGKVCFAVRLGEQGISLAERLDRLVKEEEEAPGSRSRLAPPASAMHRQLHFFPPLVLLLPSLHASTSSLSSPFLLHYSESNSEDDHHVIHCAGWGGRARRWNAKSGRSSNAVPRRRQTTQIGQFRKKTSRRSH